MGVKVVRKTTVGDNRTDILTAFAEAEKRADIVLITGGLGPTQDDLTKPLLAEFFDCEIIEVPEAVGAITAFFLRRGREMTPLNILQGHLPSCCTYVPNEVGTAPGMWFDYNGKVIVSMPGVPLEMKYLINNEVIARLKSKFELPEIVHKIVRTIGLGESFLAERIESWEDNLPEHIKLAYLPSFGEVKLRLTGIGENRTNIEAQIEAEINKLVPLIEEHIYSFENDEIEKSIGNILNETKQEIDDKKKKEEIEVKNNADSLIYNFEKTLGELGDKLTKEDKEDIKQKIMLNLFIKEKEGVLSGDVDNNKNYIFLSLKNEIIYRIYTKKNLVDSYEVLPDIKTSYPTIEQDIDNGILSNRIIDILKSNKFNIIERLLILNLLSNGTDKDFKERENISRKEYNKLYSNVKSKIKSSLSPTYKYLLVMNDGTKYRFQRKNELLNKIRMSADQFDAYIQLGKTKFKNYKIIVL
jgi:molybdopterin-biosynthesis enzyme MoeA-like protein